MRDDNCIFCKIANGDIPAKTLFEDEKCRVILDVGPATEGHALVLTKDHYSNLFELPEEDAMHIMSVAKKVALVMAEKLKCDGLNIVQNNGETAGQTVFHFHMHLIPRYKGDNQIIGWKPTQPTSEDLEKVLNKILAE